MTTPTVMSRAVPAPATPAFRPSTCRGCHSSGRCGIKRHISRIPDGQSPTSQSGRLSGENSTATLSADGSGPVSRPYRPSPRMNSTLAVSNPDRDPRAPERSALTPFAVVHDDVSHGTTHKVAPAPLLGDIPNRSIGTLVHGGANRDDLPQSDSLLHTRAVPRHREAPTGGSAKLHGPIHRVAGRVTPRRLGPFLRRLDEARASLLAAELPSEVVEVHVTDGADGLADKLSRLRLECACLLGGRCP